MANRVQLRYSVLLILLSVNGAGKEGHGASALNSRVRAAYGSVLFALLSVVLGPLYLYLGGYTGAFRYNGYQQVVGFTLLVDYYRENQAGSLLFNDLKGLSLSLFLDQGVALIAFLFLLLLASLIVALVQLQVSNKEGLAARSYK